MMKDKRIFPWDNHIETATTIEQIGARKCKLIIPSLTDTIDFLDKFHYQKSCNGQIIRFGLEYENQLVGIMTFGYPRYNKKFQYELLRLCFHPNYNIIGGSKKLFNAFIKEYTPNSVISYCDKSKFTGDVYLKLGMQKITVGQPRIHYWREKDKRHITMAELIKYGPDKLLKLNYGKGIKNTDIMKKEGFIEILDEGQDSYLYLDDEKYFGYIYCTTEITTGKKYVGQHVSNEFDPTYQGGSILIGRLLKKHPENFKTEVLEWCKQNISEREVYWIKKLNTLHPNGYNLTTRLQGFSTCDTESISIRIKKFYKTKRGQEVLKQNTIKIKEYYASDKGKETLKRISEKNKQYYASKEGQVELKRKAKNYSDFCKTEAGKKMTTVRNQKLKELNQTNKGKEKEKLRIQSLRDFYASEEGKAAKAKQVANFIENNKSEERQKKRKEQAQRYSEWANSPEGQATLHKAAQEKRERFIQKQIEKVNAISNEEWEEFKKKYPRTTLGKYRKK